MDMTDEQKAIRVLEMRKQRAGWARDGLVTIEGAPEGLVPFVSLDYVMNGLMNTMEAAEKKKISATLANDMLDMAKADAALEVCRSIAAGLNLYSQRGLAIRDSPYLTALEIFGMVQGLCLGLLVPHARPLCMCLRRGLAIHGFPEDLPRPPNRVVVETHFEDCATRHVTGAACDMDCANLEVAIVLETKAGGAA